MKMYTHRGMVVRVWEKSFSADNGPVLWLGNDNREEVIRGLIDTIADNQQAIIKGQLRSILGIKQS